MGKSSCCCGATPSKPCLCMKQDVMSCSAKAPMCPCYKALAEKNAEFLYYYVLNEKGESPADFDTLEEAQAYVANSNEPLEIYERRSRDDEANKMDKKMNAESFKSYRKIYQMADHYEKQARFLRPLVEKAIRNDCFDKKTVQKIMDDGNGLGLHLVESDYFDAETFNMEGVAETNFDILNIEYMEDGEETFDYPESMLVSVETKKDDHWTHTKDGIRVKIKSYIRRNFGNDVEVIDFLAFPIGSEYALGQEFGAETFEVNNGRKAAKNKWEKRIIQGWGITNPHRHYIEAKKGNRHIKIHYRFSALWPYLIKETGGSGEYYFRTLNDALGWLDDDGKDFMNAETFEAQGKPTWAGYCPFCKKWRTTEWSKIYGGDTVCAKIIPDPHYNSGDEALFVRENFARKGGKWIRPKENICGVVLEKKQSKNAEYDEEFGAEAFEARENKDGTIVLTNNEWDSCIHLYNGNYLWGDLELKLIDDGLKNSAKFKKETIHGYEALRMIHLYERLLRKRNVRSYPNPNKRYGAESHRDSKGRFAEKPILTGSVIGGLALGLMYIIGKGRK